MKRQWTRLVLCAALLVAGWSYALRFQHFSQGVEADLYPSWYAAREVFIEHRSPYSDEAARSMQRAIYGRTVAEGGTPMRDEQRFVYPLFGIFVLAPLALLSFAAAQKLVFWIFIMLALAGTWLWARVMGVSCTPAMLALAMASFPVTSGIVIRQPTVLYLFLLALTVWAARSERYLLAGMAAALAAAKPQLAIPVLLPLIFWIICDWARRKRIAVSFAATFALLLGGAFLLQPGWVPEWMRTVAAYRTYADTRSVLGLASPLFAAMGVFLLWRERRDFDFALALSVAGAYFLVPLQSYDEPILVPALLWIWRERKQILELRFARTAYGLLVFLALASMAMLALVSILPPSPILFAMPWRMFLVLGTLPLMVLLLCRYVPEAHSVPALDAKGTHP